MVMERIVNFVIVIIMIRIIIGVFIKEVEFNHFSLRALLRGDYRNLGRYIMNFQLEFLGQRYS